MKKILSYVIPVAICFVSGFIASRLQADAIESWYPLLNKPFLTPPNSVFPIAWGIIYVLSGISIGLIWNQPSPQRSSILLLWGMQQTFNFTWSILFFTFRNPLLGFINIILLDILVLRYIMRTWPVNLTASLLFWPYMFWLLFATYLNGFILFFN